MPPQLLDFLASRRVAMTTIVIALLGALLAGFYDFGYQPPPAARASPQAPSPSTFAATLRTTKLDPDAISAR